MNTNIAYLKTNNIKYFKLLNILIILPQTSPQYERLIYPKSIVVHTRSTKIPVIIINIH